MTRPSHLLDATTTAAVSTSTDSSSSSPPLDSDLVVILAVFLFVLICVLGLTVNARCAWIRRLFAPSSSSTSSSPPTQSPYSAKVANKGVKKKTLLSLPKLTFSSDQNFSDCAICLTSFIDGDELRVLPQCGHVFHVPCIDTWLGSHSSCPSCRRILVIRTPPVPDKTDDNSRCSNVPASPDTGRGGMDDDGAKRIADANADSVSNDRFVP